MLEDSEEINNIEINNNANMDAKYNPSHGYGVDGVCEQSQKYIPSCKIGSCNQPQEDMAHRIDRRVVDILLNIGVTANLHGYCFLKDSIKLAMKNPTLVCAVTRTMYPQIALKYGSTIFKVEKAIRHAIEVSFNKGKMVCLNNIFGLNLFDRYEKPTNSEFIALIANRLALEFIERKYTDNK